MFFEFKYTCPLFNKFIYEKFKKIKIFDLWALPFKIQAAALAIS